MKLKLTEQSELGFEKAGEEPFYSINQVNGISVDSFLSLLKEIYEDARVYLLSSTKDLINVVKKCLEADYSGLRARERELVWKPGVKMKI